MKSPFEIVLQCLTFVADFLYIIVIIAMVMKLFELWG